jgi:hypothetical protein
LALVLPFPKSRTDDQGEESSDVRR